jgi:hypothetical protein
MEQACASHDVTQQVHGMVETAKRGISFAGVASLMQGSDALATGAANDEP